MLLLLDSHCGSSLPAAAAGCVCASVHEKRKCYEGGAAKALLPKKDLYNCTKHWHWRLLFSFGIMMPPLTQNPQKYILQLDMYSTIRPFNRFTPSITMSFPTSETRSLRSSSFMGEGMKQWWLNSGRSWSVISPSQPKAAVSEETLLVRKHRVLPMAGYFSLLWWTVDARQAKTSHFEIIYWFVFLLMCMTRALAKNMCMICRYDMQRNNYWFVWK